MFEKTNTARFFSHLDLQQVWQRTLRRARIPLSLSQGYNPHPKISFGSALPVGVSSLCEYVDLELKKGFDLNYLKVIINEKSPQGIKIVDIAEVPAKSKSLMSIINRAEYKIEQLLENCSVNETIVNKFLAQKEIIVTRETKKGKKIKNIRPGIYELTISCSDNKLELKTTVQTGSEGNIRPQEVLNAFIDFTGLKPISSEKIIRTHLFAVNKNCKTITSQEILGKVTS
jgi:radical SAM-linked protein